ncbi:hypothetical protein IFU39_00155 [Paenibacillus sp. CFBP 13594]|uniref:hypothetical protein n=1 Tax=Paenibacillus sp. CFBP 13594 TaxID=2774037 RepID=UPI001781809C|nr:hypothetical protein [Paenibacillus sp. CFBP 13594]MBD8836230.1 hypothetical protein [Paenibacillus sp. CFBP 13594]
MTTENIFEIATKTKIRFQFKGLMSTEDLWDLSVENLDSIFKTLNSQLKQVKEESLLNSKTKEDKELDVKIELVKHIVSTKLAEKEAQFKAKAQKEQKQKIQEILFTKQNQELENKSVEELQAMLGQLDK